MSDFIVASSAIRRTPPDLISEFTRSNGHTNGHKPVPCRRADLPLVRRCDKGWGNRRDVVFPLAARAIWRSSLPQLPDFADTNGHRNGHQLE